MMHRRFVSGVLLATLLLLGVAAWAEDNRSEEARVHFRQGVDLFKDGEFVKAAVEFQKAYDLNPSYKILYNIAQTENELKHYAKALESYLRYLELGSAEIAADRKREVSGEIRRLETLVGQITIDCPTKDAVVFLDDKRQGTTPLPGPLFVDLGDRSVVVKSGGVELHREIVSVAGGDVLTLKVEIGGAAPAAVVPTSEAVPAAAPTAEPTVPTAEEPPRLWTWVAFGVGGAAAIGAAVTGGLAVSKASEVNDRCVDNSCPVEAEGDADTATTLGWTSTALVGVAAVGLAAGIVLWFYEPELGSGEPVVVAPTATADGGGVVLTGRF